MKDSKLKVVLVNVAFIFLPLVFGVILLFSVFTGFIGTWFIFQDWIFSPLDTGLNRDAVIKICKGLGLLGGIFGGYLSCFWMIRVFPSPPPYVIWRSKKKKVEDKV